MDSTVVNKLIRSEIWPILRNQGFSKFESRNAFRHHGPFIDVVNFQSFNSYLADGVGCTTFSFALNLGVYVAGSAREHLLKRDSTGALLPREYDCSFRTNLKKRTPVDGFARADIFFMDGAGRTAAACFQEVRHLLTEIAPGWFRVFGDVERLTTWMGRGDDLPPGLPAETGLNFFPGHGSHAWHDLFAMLRLVEHEASPTPQTAAMALREIEHGIRAVLDLPKIVSNTVSNREAEVLRVREFGDRLGPFAPAWARSLSESMMNARDDLLPELLSIREEIWPALRNQGFQEFTQRLAHRAGPDSILVVEVAPMDTAERKAWALRERLFRVGVGVFWPVLQEGGSLRVNRAGEPRPKVAQCHLSNWLLPERRRAALAPTAFSSAEDARKSLTGAAARWFHSFGEADSCLPMLQLDDSEIFGRFPMMRGCGSKSSARRLILLAGLASQLGQFYQRREYLQRAGKAVEEIRPEEARPHHRQWLDDVRTRLRN